MKDPFLAGLPGEVEAPRLTAKIVSRDTDPRDYFKQTGERGGPDFCMSYSELKRFAECPHKWLAGCKEETTSEQSWGSLMDCMILQPKRYRETYTVQPSTYPDPKTGEAKPWHNGAAYCKRWSEEQKEAGRITITGDMALQVDQAGWEFFQNKTLFELCKPESSDVQVYVLGSYEDAETGLTIPVRGMIDLVPIKQPFLVDLKTCVSAQHRDWLNQVFRYRYHIQAAFYLDLFNAATGEDRQEFRHVLQESTPPYETARRILSSEFIKLGRAKYHAALKLYCQCLKNNFWPGYDDQQNCLVPGWMLVEPTPYMME